MRSLDVSQLATPLFGEVIEARLSGEGNITLPYGRLFDVKSQETWSGIEGSFAVTEFFLRTQEIAISNQKTIRVSAHGRKAQVAASFNVNGGHVQATYVGPIVPASIPANEFEIQMNASVALRPLQKLLAFFVPNLSVRDGTLRCETTLWGPGSRLQAKGSIHIDECTLAVVSKDAESFFFPHGTLATMTGTITAMVEGHVQSPSGSMTVQVNNGTLFGLELTNVKAVVSSDGTTVSLHPTVVHTRGGDVSLEATLGMADRTVSGWIGSSEIDLATITPFKKAGIVGAMSIQGRLQGRLSDPSVVVEAPVEHLYWDGVPLGTLEATLQYYRSQLEVSISFPHGQLKTSLQTHDEYPYSIAVSLVKMPFDPLLRMAGVRDAHAELTGRADVRGTISRPHDIFGTILCNELTAARGNYRIMNTRPITISLDRERALLHRCDLTFNESPVSVQGSLWKVLDITVDGTLPVELANGIVEGLRCGSGSARVDVHVRRGPQMPLEIKGGLELHATQVQLPQYPYPLESVSSAVTFDGPKIHIASCTGEFAHGSVSLSGSVGLEPLSFDQVHLEVRSAPYRIPDTLQGTWSGMFTLDGDVSSSLLQGTVRIEQARYFRDVEIAGEVLGLGRPAVRAAARTYPELARNMALDIHIKSGQDLIVKNNIARLILSMDLRLLGTAAEPLPQGFFKIIEGRVYYSEKQFEIMDGHLEYVGVPGAEPILHVSSRVGVRGQKRDYEIFLDLDGPLDRIRLSLRSVPELEQEDIVFVLLTGQTQSEYLASSAGAGPGDTTRQLAFIGLTSLVGSSVKSWTGIDTFLMEPAKGKELGVKTIFGKRVSERVDVRGILNVGSPKGVNEAQVEYRLTDILYLVGTQRSDGTFGLDIRVRYQGD